MTLLVSNIFSNPRQITYSNISINVAITNSALPIGTSDPTVKIFVEPPLQRDELEDVQVNQIGLETGSQTELIFSYKLKNSVPEDSIVILSLPPTVLLYEGYSRQNTLIC